MDRRMAKIKIPTPPSADENEEQLELIIVVGPFQRTVWELLTKLILLLPYDVAVLFLGACPRKTKTYVRAKLPVFINTEAQMFTAAFL